MSPRKLHILVEIASVVLPEAANHTTNGNIPIIHTASKTPFQQKFVSLLINGTWNKASSTTVHIQKTPCIFFAGLNTRESNMPKANGHSIRNEPPNTFMLSTVQPTPMDPYPDWSVMANHARRQHSNAETQARIFVGNLCRIKAYMMLPIYSKKSDQHGPFSGNISPFPRTSRGIPGKAGIIRHEHKNARMVMANVECVPSQRSIPVSRNDTRPIAAPITTIG